MERDRVREIKCATSGQRRSWYGHGTLIDVEKSQFSRYLHDTSRLFSEIAILGLPALYAVLASTDISPYGVKAAALVGWATMTFVGSMIRSGWIQPLATDKPGWVSLAPTLLVLRVFYYNVVLAVMSFGSPLVADFVGVAIVSLPIAFVIGLLSVLAFPRLAELVYYRVNGPA